MWTAGGEDIPVWDVERGGAQGGGRDRGRESWGWGQMGTVTLGQG